MNLTPEQREEVLSELKKFAADLQLTDDQKDTLHGFLIDAQEKLADYRNAHPKVTRADLIKQVASHRDQIRGRLVEFLTPEQLRKWDTAATRAKEFLGQQIAA